MPNLFKALPRNRSTIALAAALAASPALAAQDYPPGLFENSPVLPRPNNPPSGRRHHLDHRTHPTRWTTIAMGSPSALFRSLAEVKRAHARCDNPHPFAPLWPPAEDQSDQ